MIRRLLHSREAWEIAVGALLFAGGLFTHGTAVSAFLFIAAALVLGAEIAWGALRKIRRRDFFDEQFLMTVAAVGAMIIGEFAEGAAVLLFFRIGEEFEHLAVRRSRASVAALMRICPDRATLLRDGAEVTVDAEEIHAGDLMLLRAGDRIAADCTVSAGSASVDASAITGESLPVSGAPGVFLPAGAVVTDGMLQAQALRPASESAAARVLELVEEANERKSKQETFISAFSRRYTPAVVLCALLLALIPPLILGGGAEQFSVWAYRALSFLVVSCPCALVISVPLAFFGGIGAAASRGILYKGGGAMEPLSRVRTAVFDKTGTLTSGNFTVDGVIAEPGISEQEVLLTAAHAEAGSGHPLARAICAAAPTVPAPRAVREYAGKGLVADTVRGQVAAGNRALLEQEHIAYPDGVGNGILVARDGTYIGEIRLRDDLKPETPHVMRELKRLGVRQICMLTGDREENAAPAAQAAGIDRVYAQLLPAEKYEHLEQIMQERDGTVFYAGDGINDAAVLARADVGIAMGAAGSDAAIEAGDVVLMSDTLERLPEAIVLARRTLTIARQNIVFALGVKLAVLVLTACGVTGMWMAVFADVGVSVLAILNSMRTLRLPRTMRRA